MLEKEHGLQVQGGGSEFKSQLFKRPNEVGSLATYQSNVLSGQPLNSSRILVGDDNSILKEDTYFDNPETLQMNSQMTKQQVQAPSSKGSAIQLHVMGSQQYSGKALGNRLSEKQEDSFSQIAPSSSFKQQQERKTLNIKTYQVREVKKDNCNKSKHANGGIQKDGSPVASCEDLKMISPAGVTPTQSLQQPQISEVVEAKSLDKMLDIQKLAVNLKVNPDRVQAIDSKTNLVGIVAGQKLLMKSLLYGRGRPKSIQIKGNILQAKQYYAATMRARNVGVDKSLEVNMLNLKTSPMNRRSYSNGEFKINKESVHNRGDTVLLQNGKDDSQQLRDNQPMSATFKRDTENDLMSGEEPVNRKMSDAVNFVSEEEFPAISIMEGGGCSSPTKTAYLNEQDLLSGDKLIVSSQETHLNKHQTLISEMETNGKNQQILTLKITSGLIDGGASSDMMIGSESSLATKVPIVQIYKSTQRKTDQDSLHQDTSVLKEQSLRQDSLKIKIEHNRVQKKSDNKKLAAFLTSPKMMFYNNTSRQHVPDANQRTQARQMNKLSETRYGINVQSFNSRLPVEVSPSKGRGNFEATGFKDQLSGYISQEVDVAALQSQYGINRKNSLISSLVLSQNQNQNQTPVLPGSTIQMKVNRERNSHFHRTTNLALSLQEEQSQLEKMLNPWSSVIGGQSRRYFKQRQFKSVNNSTFVATPLDSTGKVVSRAPPEHRQRVETAPQPPNCGGFYRTQERQNSQNKGGRGSLTGWGGSTSFENRSQSNHQHRASSNFQSQIIDNLMGSRGSKQTQRRADWNGEQPLNSIDPINLQQRRRPRTNQVNTRQRRNFQAPSSGQFNFARTSQQINLGRDHKQPEQITQTQVLRLGDQAEQQQRHCSPSTANFHSKTTLNSETKLKQNKPFSCQSEFASQNRQSRMAKNPKNLSLIIVPQRNLNFEKLSTPMEDRSHSVSKNRHHSGAKSPPNDNYETVYNSPLNTNEKERMSEQRKKEKPNFFNGGKLTSKVAEGQDMQKSILGSPPSAIDELDKTQKLPDENTLSDLSATPLTKIRPIDKLVDIGKSPEKKSQNAKSNIKIHSRSKQSRLTENILLSIKNQQRKLSRRLSPRSVVPLGKDDKVLHVVNPLVTEQVDYPVVECPLPQKRVMLVSEYSFDDNKVHLRRSNEMSNGDLLADKRRSCTKHQEQQQQQTSPQIITHLKQHQQFFQGQAIQREAIKTSLAIPDSTFQLSQGTAQLEPISEIACTIMQTSFRERMFRKASQPSILDDKSSVVEDLIPKYQDSMITPTQIQGTLQEGKIKTSDFRNASRTQSIGLQHKKYLSQMNAAMRLTPSMIVSEEKVIEQTEEKESLFVGKPSCDDYGIENQVGLFTSQAQLNSERSEMQQTTYELTNLKLGSHFNQ